MLTAALMPLGISFAARNDREGTGAILESLKTLNVAEAGDDKSGD